MSSQTTDRDVVVLGAGVIGLSAALELSAAGYKPAIVARDLPEDLTSTGFSSPWAGCNWHSFVTEIDSPAAQWDAVTYRRLADLAVSNPELCKMIDFIDVFSQRTPRESVWFSDLVGLTEVDHSSEFPLPGGRRHGHTFRSYVLHAPNYILHLASRVRAEGIPLIRARLSSLDEAYDLPGVGSVDLVVNASGLGALCLIGVEDTKVYPARGQTVLARAPQVNRCILYAGDFGAGPGQVSTKPPVYMIPRPGTDGHIILGGTYLANNYSTLPDLAEANRILQDCFALEPDLAPGGTWRDIEVISHNVGLRPAREGGARLEIEHRSIGTPGGSVAPRIRGGKRDVVVVHAYGFGGSGFQASLGAAEAVTALVQRHHSPGGPIIKVGISHRTPL